MQKSKTVFVGFRAPEPLIDALLLRVRAEDLDISKFIRRAIRKEIAMDGIRNVKPS